MVTNRSPRSPDPELTSRERRRETPRGAPSGRSRWVVVEGRRALLPQEKTLESELADPPDASRLTAPDHRRTGREFRFPARSARRVRNGAPRTHSLHGPVPTPAIAPFRARPTERRERDSNPRTLSGQWFSRPPPSAARPSLRSARSAPQRYCGFGSASSICCAVAAATLSGSTSIAISRCSAATTRSPLLR